MKEKQGQKPTLSFRVPPETKYKLKAIEDKFNTTRTDAIVKAIDALYITVQKPESNIMQHLYKIADEKTDELIEATQTLASAKKAIIKQYKGNK